MKVSFGTTSSLFYSAGLYFAGFSAGTFIDKSTASILMSFEFGTLLSRTLYTTSQHLTGGPFEFSYRMNVIKYY
jgi:hypothetical protein